MTLVSVHTVLFTELRVKLYLQYVWKAIFVNYYNNGGEMCFSEWSQSSVQNAAPTNSDDTAGVQQTVPRT